MKPIGLLVVLAAIGLFTPLSAQTRLYTFGPDYPGHEVPPITATAGDVNADGHDDIIVAWYWDYTKSTTGDGARVYSGRDGALLFSIQTQRGGAGDVAGAGDLDRDGYDDVAALVHNYQTSRREIWYVSGKTGKRFRTVVLPATSNAQMLAKNLAAAGDVNRDGYPDLLVSDWQYLWYAHGRVMVISGKDGSVIHDLKGLGNAWEFGFAIAGAGDVDGDRYADFLVGDLGWGTRPPWRGPGRAWLYSGKTGKVIWTFSEPSNPKFLPLGIGVSVAGLGDVDGDGTPDLAIGAHGYTVSGKAWAGAVHVYSGKTGKRIRTLWGQYVGGYLGYGVASAGDWNVDGVPDLAVAAVGDSTKALMAGAVYVYSGKDSKLLASIYGTKKWQRFGWGLARAGDLDGDKRSELLIGMLQVGGYKPRLLHQLEVWSPARKSLWTDTHKVSLARQGKQILQLDAGVKHAGSAYFLLGSMSGVQPGLKLGVHILPLQLDAYFWLTATVPNSSFLQNSLGVLDKNGKARASFVAVQGLPKSLAGAKADHAYVLFGKSGFTMTSNWVPLLFDK